MMNTNIRHLTTPVVIMYLRVVKSVIGHCSLLIFPFGTAFCDHCEEVVNVSRWLLL